LTDTEALPFFAGVVALLFFEIGTSESDSSFLTPFDFLLAPAPFVCFFAAEDFARGASSSDSSLMDFLGVSFFAFASFARIALASCSAFFSMAAFFLASLTPRGFSSSEDSGRAVSLYEGGSFFPRALLIGSSSESESTGLCLGRLAYDVCVRKHILCDSVLQRRKLTRGCPSSLSESSL
jgi:hypothetical protein